MTDDIIEFRTYRIAEGRRADFDEHFQTNALPHFERMGIRIGAFWDHPDDPETVSYTVRWAPDEDPAARWAAGAQSPPWVEAKERVNAVGPLVLSITSVFLAPRPDMIDRV
ncbi:NIPSNAP family protein [Cnuibacter physcomitrellae]|uniref:NIPSNAP family protein n=1 Tax=Cnuibacter physcomitrellae TaxID=1619308 RepID=UPI002175A5D1|nr:NIPSNAP family protein [Cnuibacter physcomitrellae]MCS5498287.1 NIPSNAP family protein [Cnuibacter physcomitrellae]